MTEAEVRKTGRSALIGKRPMTKVGRAVEKGETQGFMKIVVDGQTREILGAAILGTGGDEVDSLDPGRDVCQSAVHSHSTGDAHSPYGFGAHPDHARRAPTSLRDSRREDHSLTGGNNLTPQE